MTIFASNFLSLKNEFIIPLIQHNPSKIDRDYFRIKNIIYQNVRKVENISNNSYLIRLESGIFQKALLNEIILFYLRASLQFNDLMKIEDVVNRSWLLVTNYYANFFCATCLLRMMHQGFTYLDSREAQKISELFTILLSESVQLSSGNYSFDLKEKDGDEIVLEFKKSPLKVHEGTWHRIYIEFYRMQSRSSPKQLEKAVLLKIVEAFGCHGKTFFSTLRNDVNYNCKYACDDIDNLFYFNLNKDVMDDIGKAILKADIRKDDIDSRNQFMNLIGMYLFHLSSKLFDEVLQRYPSSISLYNKAIKMKKIELERLC
ncbi:hypothetical protein ACQ4N7_03110 [Nodosilinea sp. AN01ver1]|uniref:hypothetical protein n=1 Tax=Nodosilinea sp. AN01ver1 TaxID=3423362 RepID=UPI003D320063